MKNNFLTFIGMPKKIFFNWMLILPVLTLLSGCGGEGKAPQIGQSIVSVNGAEITVHQVNSQLQSKKIDPKQKDQISKQLVKSLIDRELLVQAAKDEKLDRNPNVMSAIQESKMKILAQAYMQSKVAKVAKPTEAEIQAFRSKNANVFENRKLYAMEEVSFVVSNDLVKDLEILSNSAKTLEEVVAWLNAKSIKFTRAKAVHAAEKLPKKLLDKMSSMVKGELVFINGPGKIVVGKLLETKLQPISVKDAKPLIERALTNQKQQAAAAKELMRLKGLAEIVYLDPSYEVKNSVVEAESSATTEVDPTENLADQAESKIADHVEKGLSGL